MVLDKQDLPAGHVFRRNHWDYLHSSSILLPPKWLQPAPASACMAHRKCMQTICCGLEAFMPQQTVRMQPWVQMSYCSPRHGPPALNGHRIGPPPSATNTSSPPCPVVQASCSSTRLWAQRAAPCPQRLTPWPSTALPPGCWGRWRSAWGVCRRRWPPTRTPLPAGKALARLCLGRACGGVSVGRPPLRWTRRDRFVFVDWSGLLPVPTA